MKKIWPTHFNPLVVSGIVLGMSGSGSFAAPSVNVSDDNADAVVRPKKVTAGSKSSIKTNASAPTVKTEPTKVSQKSKPAKRAQPEADDIEEDTSDSVVANDKDEVEIENSVVKSSVKKDKPVKDAPAMASIAEKSEPQAVIAPIPVTDKPVSSVVQETEIDRHAKSALEIADTHRNRRTHFSAVDSWKEAVRLYQEVALSQIPVSPDLKARAIINLVDITVLSPFAAIPQDKKLESLSSIIAITQNTLYSPDVRGWAKRHLAKLYLLGGFDLEPTQAKKQALALLEEVIADSAVLDETKSRAKIQLAHHYVSLAFDVTANVALEKATQLLTNVFEDENVRDALRADAKILLASIVNPYDDIKNTKRLKLLREVIANEKISISKRSKAKERLAHYYLENMFDVSPIEARKEAHKLLKELAAETKLREQERINHYVMLAEHYINVKLDLKPTESRAEALKMYQELPAKIQLNVLQNYVYQKELAHYCVINAFNQDPVLSKQIAIKIYQSLINDATLSIQQRTEIHWIVANLYITKQLDPQTGIDGKMEGLALIKRIISDPKVGVDTINQFKLNLAILFESNAFSILPSRAREEAASLLMELLADNRISAVDKQQIQARLDLLNKTR